MSHSAAVTNTVVHQSDDAGWEGSFGRRLGSFTDQAKRLAPGTRSCNSIRPATPSLKPVERQRNGMPSGTVIFTVRPVMGCVESNIMKDANAVGEVGNAKCGDIMKMYLKIEDDIIQDVKFETFGCGSAIASSSMATEMIKGKPVSEAMKLTNQAVTEALDGLPAHKLHCSVLAEEAIQSALEDYRNRQEKGAAE